MGNTKGRRRRFGSVRQLQSGQWQARYRGPDGVMRPADRTFPTKISAEQWLTRIEADLLDGDWIDPDAGLISFEEYATAWIEERPNLRPKTIRLYNYLLRCHLLPRLGSKAVADIKEPQARRWRKGLLDEGTSPITTAKAYRLLKAIMNTAVDDGLIRRNPCRIKGAGQEKSPERPVLTAHEVFRLADAIDPRYRALILLAVFASLRWGELAALRRKDINLAACTVRVERTLTALPGGGHIFGLPKSDAGLRELMDRMGHSSTRAALIYLHATSQRQRTIADAVGAMTRAALQESQDQADSGLSGTDVAHNDSAPS